MATEKALIQEPCSAIDRQLEAYEASWKNNHAAAEECGKVEDLVFIGLSVFNLLQRAEHAWRERIFRGASEFDQQKNDKYRLLWGHWLDITKKVTARAGEMENVFGSVAGAGELRQAIAQVLDELKDWQLPRLSRAVGLREMSLSSQEADELDRRMEEGNSNPPRLPARTIETRDASFLKTNS